MSNDLETEAAEGPSQKKPVSSRHAVVIAFGILLSRILGLVRERAFAHYLGNTAAGDAFKAALRIPNLLQNLLGEGVLSASFIPIYTGLMSREKTEQARLLAWRMFRLLAAIVTIASAIGVIASPLLVDLIAPGFWGEKRELTIHLTRIFFPGTAILVLSAWCLGISNSHQKFFLSYAAPVVWNLVMIAALIFFGRSHAYENLAVLVAWGAVFGSICQFVIQLPQVFSLLAQLQDNTKTTAADDVRESSQKVMKNLLPVVFGRGVVQISAYVDGSIASLLLGGAVSMLSFAQTIYLLPVSLFAMSVSAAALPTMSRVTGSGTTEALGLLGERLRAGARQIAFFVIPSAVCFIVLGKFVVSAVFQTGEFGARDTELVCSLLAAMSLGLVPTTLGRLCASTFYALHDTKTPVRFATVRVAVSICFAFLLARIVPEHFGLSDEMGLVGLGLASAIAATVEFVLLRSALKRKLPPGPSLTPYFATIFACALASALVSGALVEPRLPPFGVFTRGAAVLSTFAFVHLLLCLIFRVPEARKVLRQGRFPG